MPAWLTADAERWARLRPASWARPKWSVLALVVTVVWAIVVEPEAPCSAAAPCGPDWGGMVQMGLALGLVYWFARLPELALVAAPVLAVIVAWVELPGVGWVSRIANLAVIAALAFGWAAAWSRLAVRRGQRQTAERSAGMRHRLPEPVGPLVRGTIPIVGAVLLCAVAAAFVALGLRGIRADEDRAAHAVRTTGRVVGQGEETVRVRTADEHSVVVSSAYPEDYRIGSTVTVLEDGSWRRLAAEPYDAFGWQLLTLAVVLPGLSLLTVGSLARGRAAALRRPPVSVLRVLERAVSDVGTLVYAADDTAGLMPLLECHCVPVFSQGEMPDAVGEEADEAFDDEFPDFDEQLREAVMFGAPYEGGELVLVTTDVEGKPLVIRTASPVRLPRSGNGRALKEKAKTDDVSGPVARRLRQARVDQVAETLHPSAQPMRWGPGAVTRVGGLALAAGILAGVWYFVRTLVTEGFSWDVVPLLGLLIWVGQAAALLNWRATADSTGLHLARAWNVRHVPWERLRSVQYTDEGNVEIRLSVGDDWQLTALGWPWAERHLRIRPSHVRMAEEVTALRHHPELRPTERSRPADRGRPLAPFLLGLVALAAFAAIWG